MIIKSANIFLVPRCYKMLTNSWCFCHKPLKLKYLKGLVPLSVNSVCIYILHCLQSGGLLHTHLLLYFFGFDSGLLIACFKVLYLVKFHAWWVILLESAGWLPIFMFFYTFMLASENNTRDCAVFQICDKCTCRNKKIACAFTQSS